MPSSLSMTSPFSTTKCGSRHQRWVATPLPYYSLPVDSPSAAASRLWGHVRLSVATASPSPRKRTEKMFGTSVLVRSHGNLTSLQGPTRVASVAPPYKEASQFEDSKHSAACASGRKSSLPLRDDVLCSRDASTSRRHARYTAFVKGKRTPVNRLLSTRPASLPR